MLKDLGLASEAAISTGSVIALGELARNLFALHSSQGNGQLDFSSIVNLIKRED
jgi:3-hydroxyisobutyrate dehydrogenase